MGTGIVQGSYPNSLVNFQESVSFSEYCKHVHLVSSVFTHTNFKGATYLVSIYLHGEKYTLTFCVTDTRRDFFFYEFTYEELREIRELTDVNKSITWFKFFKALRTSFRNNGCEMNFPERGGEMIDSVECTFEMNFPFFGRTSLTFKLARKNSPTKMRSYFVTPLYKYYESKRNDMKKIEIIEKEIRRFRDKIERLKDTSEQKNREKIIKFEVRRDNERKRHDKMFKDLIVVRDRMLGKLTSLERDSFNDVLAVVKQENYIPDEEEARTTQQDADDLELVNVITQSMIKKKHSEFRKRMVKVNQFLESSNIKKQKIREDVVRMFDRVDEWNFDVFALDSLTNGQTLFVTTYTLFVKYNLLTKFHISEKTLCNALREIQLSYHPNPYHNAMHAADVTQVLHAILFKGGLKEMLSDVELFAALIAAVCHDLDHPGMNNMFQVNSGSYLAVLYNDRSVLENHHTAQAFELFRQKTCNIFSGLDSTQRRKCRDVIIKMILATDMSFHQTIFNAFRTRLEEEKRWGLEDDDTNKALSIAIKMADVSNPARPTYLYLQWAKRLGTEMYFQGDEERRLQYEISPLMDRTKPQIQNGQIAFMNYVISPMYDAFAYLLPKMQFCLSYIKTNKMYWATHTDIDDDVIIKEREKDRIRERKRKKEEEDKKKLLEMKKTKEEKEEQLE